MTCLWRQLVAFRLGHGLVACFVLASCGAEATAPEPLGSWSTTTPMTPRLFPGAGVVNGIVYAVGGTPAGGGWVATVEAYDPRTATWSSRASMPRARGVFVVAVVNGILYAIGGADVTDYSRTVDAYDPATNSWSSRSPMPTQRAGAGVGVINGIIYVVGGDSGGAPGGVATATVEAYDPSTDIWTTKAPMSIPRIYPGVAALDGILYAVGGDSAATSGTGVEARVETYDPATNRWTTRTPMPVPRAGLGLTVLGGTLYAVGGFNDRDILVTVEAYDKAGDTWKNKAPMVSQWGFAVCSYANVLYVIGGGDSVMWPVGNVQVYHP